ncbi:MAG: hypothetical protein NTZ93_00250 [Candidatus Beckwithbacteria bacterium]|nr:hypothetical protein [Candidatus Beckwithbacteria bacterium]
MPRTSEAVRELTQQQILFLMSRKETMESQTAGFIGQIDPDLSITTHAVNKLLATPDYPLRADLLHQYISAGHFLMIRGMRKEHEKPITKKETSQHLEALRNISQVMKELPESDQKSTKNSLLTLFSFAVARRPDLVKQQNFPWEAAIDAAQETPLEFMAPYFPFRFAILKQAPKDILKEKALTYAQTHKDSVLGVLYAEFPPHFLDDYIFDPELYDLIAAMPTGNKAIAHSTLLWAMKISTYGFEPEPHEKIIPEAYLNQLWESAERQWQALSPEDQGQILHAQLLSWISGMLEAGATKTHEESSPFFRFRRLVNEIADHISETGKEFIVAEYRAAFKSFPKLQVPPIVKDWFPDVAETIEAKRPKNIFQTIFQRKSS